MDNINFFKEIQVLATKIIGDEIIGLKTEEDVYISFSEIQYNTNFNNYLYYIVDNNQNKIYFQWNSNTNLLDSPSIDQLKKMPQFE